MMTRVFTIWILLLIVAVLNGGIRDRLISPRIGEKGGHVISTFILCAAIFLVARFSILWVGPQTAREALVVGLVWLGLTLIFEFLVGHYLFGTSWEKLLADYKVFRGRVWILVLLATLFAPLWAVWQQGR